MSCKITHLFRNLQYCINNTYSDSNFDLDKFTFLSRTTNLHSYQIIAIFDLQNKLKELFAVWDPSLDCIIYTYIIYILYIVLVIFF